MTVRNLKKMEGINLKSPALKLGIERKSLLAPLQDACAVAERKSTLPILSHVLLNVQKKDVFVTATDLETSLRVPLADTFDEKGEGAVCLPAAKFLSIVKASDGDIRLEIEGGKALIEAGKSKFRIPVLPANEFPVFPEVKDAQEVTIAAGTLRQLLDRTVYAAASEKVERYMLRSVLLHLKGKNTSLTAVGTDGKNMAVATAPLEGENLKDKKYILPSGSAADLVKILSGLDADESLSVQLGDNHALITRGDLQFAARLLEGAYPDYARAIPQQTPTAVQVASVGFQRALERMALIAPELGVEFASGEARLRAQNPSAGEAEEVFPAEEQIGPDVQLRLHIPSVLRILRAIEDARITIGLSDATSVALMHGAEPGSALSYKCLTMPLRPN